MGVKVGGDQEERREDHEKGLHGDHGRGGGFVIGGEACSCVRVLHAAS